MPAARFTPKHRLLLQLLREARKASGLTQRQTAARLGIYQSAIAKIEKQDRRIDVIEFLALTEAFGVSAEDILQQLRDAE
jgi:transcriptional regulator with XRE-family HTH domain